MVLQHFEHDEWVCGPVVLHHVYVGVNAKDLLKTCCETLLVELVGLLANRVNQRPIHICVRVQTATCTASGGCLAARACCLRALIPLRTALWVACVKDLVDTLSCCCAGHGGGLAQGVHELVKHTRS
jgi:hypothetical protein